MKDLISRQAAIDALCDEYCDGWQDCKHYPKCENLKVIQDLPSEERKRGEWVTFKGSNGKDYRKCTNCLHTQEITGLLNYCPICGADMRGES